MLKNLLLLIIILSVSVSAFAQNFQWAKRLSGNNNEQALSITVDAAGSVYTTGGFVGTVDFDPGPANYNLTAVGNADMYISKLDALGNFLWAKQISGALSLFPTPNSIIVDAVGNVYVTGKYAGTIDFNPGAGVSNLSYVPGAGTSDIFVTKLDASGNFAWAKSMGGANHDVANAINVDASGNVYTTGWFNGTSDFDPGAATYNLTTTFFYDVFISKLDASGNFIWAKSFGGFSYEAAASIAVDVFGNVYTTGYFNGTVDFDPGAGVTNLSTVGTNYSDAFISKLNSAGNFVWAKKVGGTGGEYSAGITTDAAGNVFTTGYYESTVDFDPGAAVFNLVSSGGLDVFISKLDAAGNFVWAKSIGGTSNDNPSGITLDALGNVYTAGYFNGTADFDPGAGPYNLVSVSPSQDIFISKLDASGNFVWAAKTGGESDDYVCGIAVDNAYNVLISGGFQGTSDFDPGADVYNFTARNVDIYVLKLGLGGLPVTLVSFEAIKKDKDAYIVWRTATETNTNKFEIERSIDGIIFNTVGQLKAAGNSTTNTSYQFTDNNVGSHLTSPVVYYRFKQWDLDGRFTYSPVRSINFNNKNNAVSVYPNPAKNALTLKATPAQLNSFYFITDHWGRQLMSGQLFNTSTTINLNKLVPGVYYVQVAGVTSETIKIVKL